jgi:RNA polymerase sigma-70 factor (ECF subfamily)
MDLKEEKATIEASLVDPENFSKIYREYLPDVYRYTFMIVRDKHKAEDITQETFLKALESLKKFEWRGISIKYWLIRISRNLSYKQFAKKSELPENEAFEEFPDKLSLESVDPVLQKDINDALLELPSVTREIITLKIWDEYTFSEIGRLVERSEAAVKMQFYRGIVRLKGILEKKKYDKAYAVYPVLFSGILQNREIALYKPPAGITNPPVWNSTNLLGKYGMKTLTLAQKIALISAAVIVVTGVGVAVWKFVLPKGTAENNGNKQNTSSVQTVVTGQNNNGNTDSGSNVSQIPADWTMEMNEACSARMPVPPKKPPYLRDENGHQLFWKYSQPNFLAYQTIPISSSSQVLYDSENGAGSGYAQSWVKLMCNPNTEDYTTDSYANFIITEMKKYDSWMDVETITFNPVKTTSDLWGRDVIKIELNRTRENGNPLGSNGEVGSDVYYAFATENTVYLILKMADNPDLFFQETTDTIFNNLEFY